jgi:pimeloyl-ACP methyl ester carboxylesterase
VERITREGVAHSFEEAGKGAPPILLIHDLGCDHTSLLPLLEDFRDRHRVVAVDLLGHGQSDRLPQAYTLAAYADDLAWLCYELGLYRPVAVGQGVGGMIAAELAACCPDLLAAVVALEAPKERLVETTAIRPYLAATWKDAVSRDMAAALSRCNVPVLYVQAAVARVDVDWLRKLCPRVVVESVRYELPIQAKTTNQVNSLIDAFLHLPESGAPARPSP